MATEYKLSYPAAQINEKLGKIVDLDTTLTHEGEAADAKATGDAVGRKVDKVDGKGLSSNDYDNAAKAKVDAIPEDPKYTDTVYDDTEVKQGLNQLKGDLSAAVSQHNTDETAHNDLRIALQGLSDRINAALDSDDATLDQMSEVVAYIKSNKSLIDAITTSKVNVADIVNDLVTNVTDKPLSAAQGIVIKTLIDALRNDKLDAAELTNAVNTALTQAKESGEFDGADGAPGKDGQDGQPGKDGTSPVVSVSAITGGHRITITDVNGTKTVDVMDGSDGKNGADGKPGADGSPGQDGRDGSDGVGIQSVVQTTTSTADGGDNVFTVTLTNGTSATFTVKNGRTGSTGAPGADGSPGKNGTSATHSWNGTVLTITSASGTSSADLKGEKGDVGPAGEPGVSPTINQKAPDATGNVTLTAADVGALAVSGGNMTGAINMNGQPISGLNDPTGDTQAARKGYVDAAKADAKAYTDSKRKTWTATITTTWSGSGPYTQSVAVPGILASDMPHITPIYSSDNATALAQKEAWACVSKAVTAANAITFSCFEDKPATAIPIQIEVMR